MASMAMRFVIDACVIPLQVQLPGCGKGGKTAAAKTRYLRPIQGYRWRPAAAFFLFVPGECFILIFMQP